MTFSANSLNEQGTVTSGEVTRERIYAYPLVPRGLTDAPKYNSITETWAEMNTPPLETKYEMQGEAAGQLRGVTIIHPDGTRSSQFFQKSAEGGKDGLIDVQETRGSDNVLLRTVRYVWGRGKRPIICLHA
jgi:hypothetical protein